MRYTRRYLILLTAFVLTALAACEDKWEEHNALKDTILKEGLMQPIKANPDLSRFAELLEETGYDDLLSSSRLFTVWAPTNEALANLDPALADDPEKLKQLVGNHISYQQYYTYSPNPTLRIKAINGKYLTWNGATSTIEGATTVEADKQVQNGVLHVIDQVMTPKMNTWEYMNSLSVGEKQRAFINSLSFDFFNPDLAEQTGVDPNTGAPIYKPGSGIIRRNSYLEEVRDITHEDSLNTFIVLTDEAFEAEYNKLEGFYATSAEDSTRRLTSWNVVKDLAFKGLYTPDNLPDTLVSLFNVKVPIDKSAIVSSYRTSNGIVYVMNSMDIQLKHKFMPIVVEAESAVRPDDFRTDQRNDRIHFRYRASASNNYDLRVFSHGYRDGMWVHYRISDLPAGTYKFYMRGAKDFGTEPLTQKLALDSVQSETFSYVTIPMNQQEDVYLGERTVDQFGKLDMYVISNLVSGDDLNPIVLDYIKLVPVL